MCRHAIPARGRMTRDGRYRVVNQGGTVYARSEGGAGRPLATSEQLGGQIVTFALGPDPTVAFVRVLDSAGVHSFYSVPVAGGAPRLLLRLDDSRHRPARVSFSADARHLYFTITQAESDIWVVALHR